MKCILLLGLVYLLTVAAQELTDDELLEELEVALESRMNSKLRNTLLRGTEQTDEENEDFERKQEELQKVNLDDTSLLDHINIDKIPRPILPLRPKNPETCCHPGSTYVDLVNGNVCDISNPNVQVLSAPSAQAGVTDECSMRAVVKVNFQKITTTPCTLTDGCLYGPYCGRRMLRIDLELSKHERNGFLFNIGDSESNNGYRGDGGHQNNDAEIDGKHPNIVIWSSDVCASSSVTKLASHNNAIKQGMVRHVTLYISDKHVRITNDNGLDETLCHRCFFALNGQADGGSSGPNEDIYIGLNRVITGLSSRNGVGVCSARFSWMCPW